MSNPPTYHREELVEDTRYAAETLESVHPDPYAGHDGRVTFHRRLEELIQTIPDDGEQLTPFWYRLQQFISRIRDGHTELEVPDSVSGTVDGRLPVGWKVVGETLYAAEIYDDEHSDLLGAQLQTVEGIELPELRQRQTSVSSADNRYGDLKHLSRALGPNPETLGFVLEEGPPVKITVEGPDGDTETRTLDVIDAEGPISTLEQTIDHPDTDGQPAYRLLGDGKTALLVLPDCHSHREIHERIAAPGGPGDELYDTRETYQQLVSESVPEDRDTMVAEIPAATEILADLVVEMEDAKTDRLVVDTRGNTGGTSLLPYILTYVLYDWDGIEQAVAKQYDATKLSELAQEHVGETLSLDTADHGQHFDFSSYFSDETEQLQQIKTQLTQMSPTFGEEVDANTHEAYYCPESVMVVTDAETFSAGMEIPVLLAKCGADIVGVPPSQSPNGPRDMLTIELPNTGLTLRLSFRHHVFQPETDGTELRPDKRLTADRFEQMGRTADAGVVLALEDENN